MLDCRNWADEEGTSSPAEFAWGEQEDDQEWEIGLDWDDDEDDLDEDDLDEEWDDEDEEDDEEDDEEWEEWEDDFEDDDDEAVGRRRSSRHEWN